MCKVSVLVPVYNVEKYLRQCLNSIVQQTLKDIEIICINDGSTDSSLSILTEFARRDSRIKIIDKANTGYGNTMNIGLEAACGEYIGIVESDDFADRTMFEQLYTTAKQYGAELVRSNFWIHQDGQKDLFRDMLGAAPYDELMAPHNYPCALWDDTFVWTSIYKKKFLSENGIRFNETSGASYQDVGFTLKVLSCAERAVMKREAFLHYRVDNINASVQSTEKVYCKMEEIASVWRFLLDRPTIMERVCRIIPRTMYNLYKANYERIGFRYKIEFLEKFLDEFQELEGRTYLKEEYWDEAMWNEMQRAIRDKWKTIFDKYKTIQRQVGYVHGFLENIRYRKLYVYGAGRIAESAIKALQRHKIKIEGIVVSKMADNPARLLGLKVSTVDSATIERERDEIIIAVKESSQYEIFEHLRKNGFQHIFILDTDLQQGLNKYLN